MIELNEGVRLVTLQFSFSNKNAVPFGLQNIGRETPAQIIARKRRATGVMVIKPTPRCLVAGFPEELKSAGYQLVDASRRECIDTRHHRKTYYTIRFVFARSEYVEVSDAVFLRERGQIISKLQQICKEALWRVRAFINPYYQNEKATEGQCAISFNFEARVPLFRPDGTPVMVWQKDENGERVGDAPLPLKAEHILGLTK